VSACAPQSLSVLVWAARPPRVVRGIVARTSARLSGAAQIAQEASALTCVPGPAAPPAAMGFDAVGIAVVPTVPTVVPALSAGSVALVPIVQTVVRVTTAAKTATAPIVPNGVLAITVLIIVTEHCVVRHALA
jgi:hypothetical protein